MAQQPSTTMMMAMQQQQQQHQVHGGGHHHGGMGFQHPGMGSQQQGAGGGGGPVMGEFLEHMFGIPGGGMFDMGAGGRGGSWDYNVGSAAGKGFGVGGISSGVGLSKKGNEGVDYGLSEVQIRHHHQQQQQQGGGARGEVAMPVGREARNGAAVHGDSLTRSVSLGSSASEDSGPQQGKSDQLMVSPSHLQQPYGGGGGGSGSGVSPLPMNFPQAKAENVLLVGGMDSHNALGKRFRDDDDGRPRTTGVMSTGSAQGSGYANPGGVPSGQPLPGIGARPRVRARRGQATDPHSIAERLRRERIAERMKALQELVPNSNKTDKASMLDEIIDYVKFLQLQVKVLSMSRLGGAGALPSLVNNDLPSEGANTFAASAGSSGIPNPAQDGLALTERQVTRMMEDDMGSAMQYLQSKGLCLMPISLATAISTTGKGSAQATANAGERLGSAAAANTGKSVTDPSSAGGSKEDGSETARVTECATQGT